ncbi:MAG: methyltransferase domain-containing protein [Candidatus Aminicenantes bacterium]|nr:methyltransferase domain-containing protein [Candidatus Aminicenantes bacterium]
MPVLKKEILDLYQEHGLLTHLYIKIKLKICPFIRMESFFPNKGKIIDLGCGNGLFPNILKLRSNAREIIGFDLDEKKIRAAKKTEKDRPGLEFRRGNIIEEDYPRGDVFSLIDVLYLIPYKKQKIILRKCSSALSAGGILIIKEMDTKPLWKYLWNQVQETFAVKIVGLTLGERFYFRSRKEFQDILTDLGFKIKSVRLDTGYWYPHIIYVCKKLG